MTQLNRARPSKIPIKDMRNGQDSPGLLSPQPQSPHEQSKTAGNFRAKSASPTLPRKPWGDRTFVSHSLFVEPGPGGQPVFANDSHRMTRSNSLPAVVKKPYVKPPRPKLAVQIPPRRQVDRGLQSPGHSSPQTPKKGVSQSPKCVFSRSQWAESSQSPKCKRGPHWLEAHQVAETRFDQPSPKEVSKRKAWAETRDPLSPTLARNATSILRDDRDGNRQKPAGDAGMKTDGWTELPRKRVTLGNPNDLEDKAEDKDWMRNTLATLSKATSGKQDPESPRLTPRSPMTTLSSATGKVDQVDQHSATLTSAQTCRDPIGSKQRRNTKNNIVRRGSKLSTWRRSKTRTVSMSPEILESPAWTWNKYLKYFNTEELNWLSENFESLSSGNRISVADAVEICVGWNEQNHCCKVSEPSEEMVERALYQIRTGGERAVAYINFEKLIQFVRICEKEVLMKDELAGWDEGSIDELSMVFKLHCKGGEILKRGCKGALSTQNIFDVLETGGRAALTHEEKKDVVEIIKEVDIDRSGDIDFEEFLKLMKKVQLMDGTVERKREHDLIEACRLSDSEIAGYQETFDLHCGDEGFGLKQFCKLFRGFRDWGPEETQRVGEKMRSIVDSRRNLYPEDSETDPILSFGEFITLISRLIDEDFDGIKSQSDQMAVKLKQEEKRSAATLDLGTLIQVKRRVSWVRTMIQHKTNSQASINHKQYLSICSKRGLSDELLKRFSEEEIMLLHDAFEGQCHSAENLPSVLLTSDWYVNLSVEQKTFAMRVKNEISVSKEAFCFQRCLEAALKVKSAAATILQDYDNKLIEESNYSDFEIASLRALFDHHQDADEGFGLRQLYQWLDSISLYLSSKDKDEVDDMFQAASHDRPVLYKPGIKAPALTFGEYVSLVSGMIASDFAQIKSKKIV